MHVVDRTETITRKVKKIILELSLEEVNTVVNCLRAVTALDREKACDEDPVIIKGLELVDMFTDAPKKVKV